MKNPLKVYSHTGGNNEWGRKGVSKGDKIYYSGEYDSYTHPFFGSYQPQFGDFTFESAGNQDIYVASLSVPAPPLLPEVRLNITKQANSYTLSWPSIYNDAVVEFSPDLSPGSWDTLDSPPSLENDHWQITLPEINDPAFYRLRYQQ